MPTLSSLLVQREVATMRAVEEGIMRQVIHGGDLPTNLLELGAVSEQALVWVLAETYALEPAPVGSLPAPDPAALKTVPGDLALRHGLFPLELSERTLVVAIAEPLSPAVEEDLSFALDVTIKQLATTMVRVREGIAAHYGLRLDKRFLRLLAKLDGLDDPHPTSMPPPGAGVGPIDLPRPATVPPVSFGSGLSARPEPERPAAPSEPPTAIHTAESAEDTPAPPVVTDRRALAGWLVRTVAKERKARARPPRRKGPFPRVMAEAELGAVASAEDALEIWYHFATQYFEYSALFSIVGDLAEGRDAHGAGAARDRVTGIGVPLDLPSSLAAAAASHTPTVKRFSDEGLDGELMRDLGAQAAVHRSTVALIPLVVRDRSVAILLGHDGEADVTFDGIGELLAFTNLVSTALERLILAKKLGRDRALVAPRVAVKPPSHDLAKGARALVQALDLPSPSPPPPPPAGVGLIHIPIHESDVAAPRHDADADGEAVDVPPYRPPPATAAAVLPLSDRPIPREDGSDGSRDAPDASEVLAAAQTPTPSGARVVRRSRLEEGPPEVVSLLHHMLEGGQLGEEAFEALLEIGEHAMGSLMAAFPGPLRVDRYRARAELPPASQCGPLLQVLVALRRNALAFVTVRSSSHDPDDRFWSTHLLGEMRAPEAATALIPRLFDDDSSVRRVARRSAAALVLAGEPGQPLLLTLDHLTQSADEPIERRVLAIETMGEIRIGPMIPSLIAVLSDRAPDVVEAARKALLLIARQDFGHEVHAWSKWWSEHRHNHRIEWLIDALMHDQPSIRRAAADELKLLTKEYFGYYDDLPTRERERAQERYREWWEREGSDRFR